MTKDIKVTVEGLQWDDSGGSGSVETVAPGEYYFRNGSHYIFYEETAEGSGGNIKTTIKLKGNLLEVKRKGAVNSRMVFEAEKRHAADHITAYGLLRMETVTSRILCMETEGCLRIRAEYELWTDGVKMSSCRLTVKAEPSLLQQSSGVHRKG